MITAEAQPDETAVESQAVWPWQAEPYRLWSLLEMLRFRAASFAATMAGLERATLAVGSHEHIEFVNQTNMDRVVLAKAIREAEPALEELPLSPVVKHQFQRIKRNAEGGLSREALSMLLRELQNNILVDLSSSWFLMIPAERRELYEQRAPVLGTKVDAVFPDAGKDIAAAGRCLALDEWTACVFHLMRVLEHGLRHLAAKVGLDADAMAHENWKNVIDQIEKKIRELEQQPRSPQKSAQIQFYSEAAVQFRYFKDAWRNHVAHSRHSYDGRDAETIWHHVERFMQHLAANP